MSKDIHFDKKDCRAKKVLDKLAQGAGLGGSEDYSYQQLGRCN